MFGEYDGHFQLRPGVCSWLTWAHETFDVVWLTSWEKSKIERLLHVTYCQQFLSGLVYADWMNYQSKAVWLSQAVPKLKEARQLFWIDDLEEVVEGVISLHVDPIGRDELLQLRERLTGLIVPQNQEG